LYPQPAEYVPEGIPVLPPPEPPAEPPPPPTVPPVVPEETSPLDFTLPPFDPILDPCPPQSEEEHKKNPRPSNLPKHEKGEARKAMDKGGEKADKRRRPKNKRPPGWKGPWPGVLLPLPCEEEKS
jgi:hypothetical protein